MSLNQIKQLDDDQEDQEETDVCRGCSCEFHLSKLDINDECGECAYESAQRADGPECDREREFENQHGD